MTVYTHRTIIITNSLIASIIIIDHYIQENTLGPLTMKHPYIYKYIYIYIHICRYSARSIALIVEVVLPSNSVRSY